MKKPTYEELEQKVSRLEKEYRKLEEAKHRLQQKQARLEEQNNRIIKKTTALADYKKDLEKEKNNLELFGAALEQTIETQKREIAQKEENFWACFICSDISTFVRNYYKAYT